MWKVAKVAVVALLLSVAACSGADEAPAKPGAQPRTGSSDINPQPRDTLRTGGTLKLSIQQWITQYNVGQTDGLQAPARQYYETLRARETVARIVEGVGAQQSPSPTVVPAPAKAREGHRLVEKLHHGTRTGLPCNAVCGFARLECAVPNLIR